MSYLEEYQKSHKHPVNRMLHTIGIPLIVLSVLLFIVDLILYDCAYWIWTFGLFLFGWILQFIGHAFEGKPPAFFSNPFYLLVGPVWWVLKIFGIKPKDKV